MASELRVDTLKDSSGNNSVGMSYVAGGSAKAWTNFNGTGTVAIRGSFGVSSISDNGTGDYTTTFSNAMNDANFSSNAFAGAGTVSNQAAPQSLMASSTTSIRTLTYFSSAFDRAYQLNQIFGDLA